MLVYSLKNMVLELRAVVLDGAVGEGL